MKIEHELRKERGVILSFEQYDLSSELLNGLIDTRIESPTSLHEQVIPQALQGKHLLVKNESDDISVFLIPALQKLIEQGESEGTQILILTPSTERAKAIDEMIWAMGYHAQISSASLSMKGDRESQEKAVLEGAPVIVANPGRLIEILENTEFLFKNLHCIIIDDAHNMENFHLVDKVKSVFKYVESAPQMLLFSGKANDATKKLAEEALKNPELIGFNTSDLNSSKKDEAPVGNQESIEKKLEEASVKVVLNPEEKSENKEPSFNSSPENVEEKLKKTSVSVVLNPEPKPKKESAKKVSKNLGQGFINVPPRMKISTLMAHLENSEIKNIIIFTASKRTSDRLFRIIIKKNWGVVSVHEGIDEETYKERFSKFTSGEMKVLVVGGISATKIDIDEVTQVINYDVPDEVDEYRYRADLVGNGKATQMVSLVSKMDQEGMKKISDEVGFAPEEIMLPKEVKEKKKKQSSKNGKQNNKGKSKNNRQSQSGKKQPNRSSKKKAPSRSKMELPRPSYDGLSGGRDGDRSGGVFGWVKKLFD